MAKWKKAAAPAKSAGAASGSVTTTEHAKVKQVHPSRLKVRRTWDEDDFHLSQSKFKAFRKYTLGQECGIVFRERDLLTDPRFADKETDAQDLGKYFEAQATGYNPEGIEAQVYSRDSSNKFGDFKKGDKKAEYQLADRQAAKFKSILEKYGLEIVEVGRFLRDSKTRISALLDVVVKLPEELKEFWPRIVGHYYSLEKVAMAGSKHQKEVWKKAQVPYFPAWEDASYATEDGIVHQGCIVIDLKFSALMDDKWNEMGWHPDFVSQRDHRIQAHTYEAITGLPFFFFVASSKDEDVNFIRSIADPDALAKHVAEMQKARKEIVRGMNLPNYWEHRPSMKRCSTCPITECTERLEVPQIMGVYFAE